ncbi:MAG: MMPL family transporter, partial [Firmicutes bacterium]|nr:MMPL family transporter [Bacillota bacterium]
VSLLLALSLDYEILLVHAMNKRFTPEAAGTALKDTGGSITGAGVIIAVTFLTLTLTPIPFLQMTGLIIGASLLLDTLVVRSVLIPSALMLLSAPQPPASGPIRWGCAGIWIGLALLGGYIIWSLFNVQLLPVPEPSWDISSWRFF